MSKGKIIGLILLAAVVGLTIYTVLSISAIIRRSRPEISQADKTTSIKIAKIICESSSWQFPVVLTEQEDLQELMKCIEAFDAYAPEDPAALPAPTHWTIVYRFFGGTIKRSDFEVFPYANGGSPFSGLFLLETVIEQANPLVLTDGDFVARAEISYKIPNGYASRTKREITDPGQLRCLLSTGQEDAFVDRGELTSNCVITFYDTENQFLCEFPIYANTCYLEKIRRLSSDIEEIIDLAEQYNFE